MRGEPSLFFPRKTGAWPKRARRCCSEPRTVRASIAACRKKNSSTPAFFTPLFAITGARTSSYVSSSSGWPPAKDVSTPGSARSPPRPHGHEHTHVLHIYAYISHLFTHIYLHAYLRTCFTHMAHVRPNTCTVSLLVLSALCPRSTRPSILPLGVACLFCACYCAACWSSSCVEVSSMSMAYFDGIHSGLYSKYDGLESVSCQTFTHPTLWAIYSDLFPPPSGSFDSLTLFVE